MSYSLVFSLMFIAHSLLFPLLLQPTPPAPRVCSTVDQLNIRAGPGTQYDVVGGLLFGQCAERVGTSPDGEWIQITDGWVAARYVAVETATPVPTQTPPAATLTFTATTPAQTATPRPGTAALATSVATQQQFGLPGKSRLAGWFTTNPLQALLLLACFYFGLLSAKNLAGWRQVLNGFVALAMAAGVILIWNHFFARFFTRYYIPFAMGSLAGPFGASLGGYAVGLLLGKLIYRRPGKVERGANTKCHVCGQMQRTIRMSRCQKCNHLFCDFPAWNHSSARAVVDNIALWIAIPLGIILTAVSIVGGLLVLAVLSLPYLVLRELLPESQIPPYWRNCGRGGYCLACAQKMSLAASYSGQSYSSGGSSSYESSQYDDQRYDEDDSDDDDRQKGGSFWDGWLVHYSNNDNDDDDDDRR